MTLDETKIRSNLRDLSIKFETGKRGRVQESEKEGQESDRMVQKVLESERRKTEKVDIGSRE